MLSPSLTDTCSAFSLIEDPALSFLECFALGLEHSLALLVVDNTALLHLFGLTHLLLREWLYKVAASMFNIFYQYYREKCWLFSWTEERREELPERCDTCVDTPGQGSTGHWRGRETWRPCSPTGGTPWRAWPGWGRSARTSCAGLTDTTLCITSTLSTLTSDQHSTLGHQPGHTTPNIFSCTLPHLSVIWERYQYNSDCWYGHLVGEWPDGWPLCTGPTQLRLTDIFWSEWDH